jgi:hypothetical protein
VCKFASRVEHTLIWPSTGHWKRKLVPDAWHCNVWSAAIDDTLAIATISALIIIYLSMI